MGLTAVLRSAIPVLAGLILAGAASTADAQGAAPSIGFVDVQAVMNGSKAARGVRPQIEKLRQDYQASVREREAELRSASRELQRQRTVLSTQAFAKKRSDYEQMARDAQVAFQKRKRMLDNAYSAAMRAVHRSMVIATAKVAEERKLDIVLPKSILLLADSKLDITKDVLSRVDKSLPTVELELSESPEGGASTKKN